MDLKSVVGKRKPKFIRQDTNRAKKLKIKWRKPKGLHSKLRLNKKGHRKTPSQGYRSPKSIRGGEKFTIIKSIEDIIEGKLMIGGNVGLRKKVEIVKYAKEKGFTILNVPNPDKFLTDVEKMLSEKKLVKKSKIEKKEKTKKEFEKKKEEKTEEKKDDAKKTVKEVKQKQNAAIGEKINTSQNVHRATAPKQK